MSGIDARNWDRPRRPTKKKMHQAARKTDFNSTPGRIRTCDRRLRRPMLYPAELRARGLAFAGFKDPHQGRAKMNCEGDDLGGQIKSGRPDSNRRLPAPKAAFRISGAFCPLRPTTAALRQIHIRLRYSPEFIGPVLCELVTVRSLSRKG